MPHLATPIAATTPLWSDETAATYVRNQRHSDDVARLAPVLRRWLRGMHQVIDLGAGTGALLLAALPRTAAWIAVEPQSYLAQCLERSRLRHPGPTVIHRLRWQDAELPSADAVVAARLPDLAHDTIALWQRCCRMARKRIIWVMGANDQPHGMPITSQMPQILAALTHQAPPPAVRVVTWTARTWYPDFASAYLAGLQSLRGSAATVHGAALLERHLASTIEQCHDGVLLPVERRSAVCVWECLASRRSG